METLQIIINSGVTATLIAIFGWFARRWMYSIENTLSKVQDAMDVLKQTVAQIDKAVGVMQSQNVTIGRELASLNKWLTQHDSELKKHGEQIARLEEIVKKK